MLIYEDDPLLLLFATLEDLALLSNVVPLQPRSRAEGEKVAKDGNQEKGRVIPIDRKKARRTQKKGRGAWW